MTGAANEDQSGHDLRVAGECAQTLAAVQVPDADRLVALAARLVFPIFRSNINSFCKKKGETIANNYEKSVDVFVCRVGDSNGGQRCSRGRCDCCGGRFLGRIARQKSLAGFFGLLILEPVLG